MDTAFVFNNAGNFETFSKERFYLLVIGLNITPPHIALIFNDTYYSSTINGLEQKKIGKDFLLRLSKKRSIALIELQKCASQLKPELFFDVYGPLSVGSSCLAPINDFIKEYYKISWDKPYLHGLLNALYENHLVVGVQIGGITLENALIPAYGQDTIDRHIHQLNASLNPKGA